MYTMFFLSILCFLLFESHRLSVLFKWIRKKPERAPHTAQKSDWRMRTNYRKTLTCVLQKFNFYDAVVGPPRDSSIDRRRSVYAPTGCYWPVGGGRALTETVRRDSFMLVSSRTKGNKSETCAVDLQAYNGRLKIYQSFIELHLHEFMRSRRKRYASELRGNVCTFTVCRNDYPPTFANNNNYFAFHHGAPPFRAITHYKH